MTEEMEIADQELFKYVSPERAMTCLPEIRDGALRATQPAAHERPVRVRDDEGIRGNGSGRRESGAGTDAY